MTLETLALMHFVWSPTNHHVETKRAATMSTTVNVKTSLGQNGCTLNTLELSVQFHSALHFRDVPQHVVSFLCVALRNH